MLLSLWLETYSGEAHIRVCLTKALGNKVGLSDRLNLRFWATNVLMMVGGLLVGCTPAASRQAVLRGGPPVAKTITPWTFEGRPARTVTTAHYSIHTTIDDEEFLNRLTQVMEGALKQYQQLTPGVPLTDKPLECYVFAMRPQWARFTSEHTGNDAAIYLQINRGGYTIGDWYVAYFIGDFGTYAVAAHEGWHQYVARHFKSRLPPFLEEGIATTFESITWPNQAPKWNLAVNLSRADRLRTAIQDRLLWPLEQLCTMHAGDVVSLSGERIETFYAQNWAFAQFMMNAENQKYRPAFQRMLSELASGEADQITGRRRGPPQTWDPRTVKPLLEHYLGMDMKRIDIAYQAYIRQLASLSRDNRPSS